MSVTDPQAWSMEEKQLWFGDWQFQRQLFEKQIHWIQLVEAASLAGWFALYDKREPTFAQALLFLSSMLLYILLMLSRRHIQIANGIYTMLKDEAQLRWPESGLVEKIIPGVKRTRFVGHQLNRLIPVVLIAFNFSLGLVSGSLLRWSVSTAVLIAFHCLILCLVIGRFRALVLRPGDAKDLTVEA